MFETSGPRLFSLPPGVDFPRALVDGLHARHKGPPEAMARVELYVNTTRMARRLREIFDQGPPTLLPRVRLLTDLTDPLTAPDLPDPVPALRRRLELTGLVSRLLDAQPGLAPRASLFDLSDSLATLMEEMQGEEVSPEAVANLDVSDQSGHWERALEFFKIVQHYFEKDSAPDRQAYARLALEARLKQWQATPPQHPILIAGSTGSRGTTADFMKAVAHLPQGALILPGFDDAMPPDVWSRLDTPLTGADHPQYRYAQLMRDLDVAPDDVTPWHQTPAPNPDRNRLISLALRPAPVTHQWLTEGPDLAPLTKATQELTLIEAPTPRDEALAIALRLRRAVQDGQTAALITPDRMLTRQVTAALDRFGILPDDSAGIPAQLTPPGRLLRHVAALYQAPLTAEALLTLLKHPLTHAGADRNTHLLHTRDLELHIRSAGWPYPSADKIRAWGVSHDKQDWANWLADTFCDLPVSGLRPLADWVADHIALAEAICAGPTGGSDPLWDKNAGRKLRQACTNLQDEAAFGADMNATDYADLFGAIIAREEVRDRDAPHPLIKIWGTLEARVMGADLLILSGLNEGSWPEMPSADPWLNRQMRAKAGLLLPERKIGLSAHDFQQAACAPEVWLTRSVKSDDAETVPSRWVNRLMNLMRGLPERDGQKALDAMKARGDQWLEQARLIEAPIPADPAQRPSPAPPLAARPTKLSVTAIKKLIRDPYAIYAQKILRLSPLDPLMQEPDALLRGTLIHSLLEEFVKATLDDPAKLDTDELITRARAFLGDPETIPFPTARALWLEKMERVAQWFVDGEAQRQSAATAHPDNLEVKGAQTIPALGFTLTAKADRIDIDDRGGAHIYDYKTGSAPTENAQLHFDKQLLLEAAMVHFGAFENLHPRHVERARYISLQPATPKEVPAPLDQISPEQVWEEFVKLMTSYADPKQGYTARRALMKDGDAADYDHLSRFGEWDVTDIPVRKGMV
ncbi:MAG: double-strand break repair protein AddB [Pelagimonas sp.]|jgi:double-strand break repair protein AddB|nr:double-strand break repair protein AddB [Pelagimonas sp.]